jgi:hypothetical protein
MALQHGRFHARTSLTVKVNLIDPQQPGIVDEAMTENVSAQGARAVVKAAKQPGTLLSLYSPRHRFQTFVRVVYCERLRGGQFGVGLELEGPSVNWAEKAQGRLG